MRVMTEQVHQGSKRWGVVVLGAIAGLVVLVLLAEGLASAWTDFLWFHYTGIGEVWTSVAWTKAGLTAVFILAAFALSWVSLYLVDKVAPRALLVTPENELVRRYQHTVGRHAALIRTVAAALLGIVLGAGTGSQWKNWLLFEHAVPFGRTDPLFHLDDSFFVFRLPFLTFLVNWILLALLVVFLVSVAAHFLNGAIRLQTEPHFEPRTVAHLSLLLGAMALVRAWGYYYVDRYRLDLSSSGVVGGAGYTDVHVRLPAVTLLAIVSLAAFVLLVVNAYQRSLTLPVIAVGLWALLALVIGVIYPAVVQAFEVNPAQASLEKPYIQRNITATRYAMGLDGVSSRRFPANTDLTPAVLHQYRTSLEDSQLWDPSFVQQTFDNLQRILPYFSLTPLAVDRYKVNGRLTPVVVTARVVRPGGSGSQSWVNEHLQYTHGYGAVVAPSTVANASGQPEMDIGNLPPTSSAGLPKLTQPDVYFAPGSSGYVIADTRQAEVDYQGQTSSGPVTSHYHGDGGVPLSSWFVKAAYALRLKDFSLLVSNDVTSHSRLLYVTGVRARVQKALPFLTVDANPYPVIDHGQIDWVVDAYTTSSWFPYGQPALTGELSTSSPLSGRYDFVRDAVKVVVNAYTGKMRFYAVDPANNPILRSYERAFPGLFQPLSSMDPTLRAHLRYPQALLAVQATMYGRYHVTNADELYANSNAWDLAQTSTSTTGSPSAPLPLAPNGMTARYQPIYELLELPGAARPSFEAVAPLVPFTSSGQELKTLSAVLFANSSYQHYGQLESLVVSRPSVDGPGLANADILHDPVVSKEITFLNQNGSRVTLGTVQLLPIADSLLYVRPLYVSSAQSAFPELVDVIVLYGKQIAVEPTLSAALRDVFGTAAGVRGTGRTGASTSPLTLPSTPATSTTTARARKLVDRAAAEFAKAERALASSDLGAYQKDAAAAAADIAEAKALLGGAPSGGSGADSTAPRSSASSSTSSSASTARSPAAGTATAASTAPRRATRRGTTAAGTAGSTRSTAFRSATVGSSASVVSAAPKGTSRGASARTARHGTFAVPALSVPGAKVGAVESPVAAVSGTPTGPSGH